MSSRRPGGGSHPHNSRPLPLAKTGYTGKPTQHKSGGGAKPPAKKGGCCPMVAAVRSAKDGQWRKARLYARLAGQTMRGRVVAWAA